MRKVSLNRIYRLLLREYGSQGWWPGDTDFEIVIGAILTQNIAWKNVETAIFKLKEKNLLNPDALNKETEARIAPLIRSTGYFNQKARKIKNFLNWFEKYSFSFDVLKELDLQYLRKELLSINGVGPETADSILLYALLKKTFVVDAYTKRIFQRLGVLSGKESYSDIQEIFHKGFSGDIQACNEYHALIVNHGKDICRPKPLCEKCCIEGSCDKNGLRS